MWSSCGNGIRRVHALCLRIPFSFQLGRTRYAVYSVPGLGLRCSFYLAPTLQSFLQSVDRVGQLTNLIASIDIGCRGQVSLADAIRHLFEVGERFADAATD